MSFLLVLHHSPTPKITILVVGEWEMDLEFPQTGS